MLHTKGLAIALLTLAAATACSGTNDQAKPAPPAAESAQAATAPAAAARDAAPPAADADAPLPDTASPFDALPDAVRQVMDKPFTGDFDALVARRVIRVGVTFNRTHYFIDAGQQRGVTYESVKLFEDELNAAQKNGNLKVNVAFVPLSRDQLYPALVKGTVDLVAAMVTVTPEREKLVAFSEPTRTDVSQLVVTGPGAPPIAALDDLAGKEVFIRKGSIYAESVARLNAGLKARGKPAVIVKEAPEVFEDDDILEMVNAGLVNATIVDDYLDSARPGLPSAGDRAGKGRRRRLTLSFTTPRRFLPAHT